MPNLAGLTTLMRSGRKAEPVPTAYENLSLLPAGPPLGNEIEELHVQFGFLLRELLEGDVFVLVDTPTVLPVSDARLVASHVSSVLLVVASGVQRPSTLVSALESCSSPRRRCLASCSTWRHASVGTPATTATPRPIPPRATPRSLSPERWVTA